jgi:hypothetical protein
LEENKIGQKFDYLAHSGECNWLETPFYFIFGQYE